MIIDSKINFFSVFKIVGGGLFFLIAGLILIYIGWIDDEIPIIYGIPFVIYGFSILYRPIKDFKKITLENSGLTVDDFSRRRKYSWDELRGFRYGKGKSGNTSLKLPSGKVLILSHPFYKNHDEINQVLEGIKEQKSRSEEIDILKILS